MLAASWEEVRRLERLTDALEALDVQPFRCGGRVVLVKQHVNIDQLTEAGMLMLLKALVRYCSCRGEAVDLHGMGKLLCDQACVDAVCVLLRQGCITSINLGESEASPDQWLQLLEAVHHSRVRWMYLEVAQVGPSWFMFVW